MGGKHVKRVLIGVAAIVAITVTITSLITKIRTKHNRDGTANPNFRMEVPLSTVMAGPYGKGIDITRLGPGFKVHIKARRMYFRKGRLLMLTTPLTKKMVVENLTLTLYRKGKRVLELKKPLQKMSKNMEFVTIKDPKVVFPLKLSKMDVERIKINLKNGTATILTKSGVKLSIPSS